MWLRTLWLKGSRSLSFKADIAAAAAVVVFIKCQIDEDIL